MAVSPPPITTTSFPSAFNIPLSNNSTLSPKPFLCGALMAIPGLNIFLKKSLQLLAGLFACCGSVIAGRQIYLQNLPSDQIPTCAPPMDFLMDTLPFFQAIQTILLGDGNCAEYEWRFILNFAEWALIFFILLFIYNIFFLLKKS